VRRFEEAITAFQGDLTICRETGDRYGEAMALGNLGMALQEAAQFDEAITAFHDAAAIFRETRDNDSERIALDALEVVRAAQRA
jgi:tetratricopeptide (TPR) repeat protein